MTRTLQGLAGAAVAVVAMAVVRDLFTGIRAAQLLSRLILVLGVAPILAPSLGSALLNVTSWRGIFVALAAAAVGLWVIAWRGLPETSAAGPAPARHRARLPALLRPAVLRPDVCDHGGGGRTDVRDPVRVRRRRPVHPAGRYGLSPQTFGLAFSANAVGLIAMTQLNPVLVGRFGPVRVLSVGVLIAVVSAIGLLVTTLTGFGGLLGFCVPLFFVVSSAGLSFPNAPAIALSRHGEIAGTAAAVLGAAQFMIGGAVAPLVGALDDGTGTPLAAIIVGTTGLAATLFWSARGRLLGTQPA